MVLFYIPTTSVFPEDVPLVYISTTAVFPVDVPLFYIPTTLVFQADIPHFNRSSKRARDFVCFVYPTMSVNPVEGSSFYAATTVAYMVHVLYPCRVRIS